MWHDASRHARLGEVAATQHMNRNDEGVVNMKKQIMSIVDKILEKGQAVIASEKAQELLASPKVQKALEVGVSALSQLADVKEAAKAAIVANLGLATQKDLEELRNDLKKVEEAKMAEVKSDDVQA